MGINQEKYRQMSVDGKWIAIAIEVVRDNPGMTRSELIAEASVFMPTFIVIDGKKRTKISLAIRATAHCSFKRAVVEQDGRLYAKPKYRKRGFTFEIIEHAKKHGKVSHADFPEIKNFCSLASQQCKLGNLTRISSGVYGFNSEVNNV